MTKVDRALEQLRSGPKTNAQIAEALDTNSVDVARMMSKLIHRGVVERELYHRRHQSGGTAAVYRLKRGP